MRSVYIIRQISIAVALNVTGDPDAIEGTIERAVDFFGAERLWMTHRLADTETVQVTMITDFHSDKNGTL